MSSQLLAYGAFGLLAISFLLAGEGFGLDRLFGSHARQFRLHHRAAILAVIAVVVHAGYEFWLIGRDDWRLLFDPADPALMAGWMAAGLLAIAFTSAWATHRFRRRAWLRLHWLTVPAILLAALHGSLFEQGVATSLLLFALAVLALVPLLKHLPSVLPFGLAGIRCRARRIESGMDRLILLEIPVLRQARFNPGQFVSVRFAGPHFTRHWHPFSVASCGSGTSLRLLIRPAGRDTSQLLQVTEVDVDLRGPFEDLHFDDRADSIWIAGGIGIAPFVGRIACLPQAQRIRLLYFHRPKSPIGRPDLLDAVAERHGGFEWREVVHPGEAGCAESILSETVSSLPGAQVMVCGPPAFTQWICEQLKRLGLPGCRIQSNGWTS